MKKKIMLLMLALLLAWGGYSIYEAAGETEETAGKTAGCSQTEAAAAGVLQGQQAPGFTLQALDGSQQEVRPGDGNIYVLNFWATWCPPCRGEMPELESFAKAQQGKVKFFAIDLQEKQGTVQGFMRENGYTFPMLLDVQGKAGTLYNLNAIPTTVVIDGRGIIKLRKTGPTTRAELEQVVAGQK